MKYFQPASRLAGVRYERDQQHRRQRGRFHRHPHESHVVGGERDQHGRHEQLVHAVIQPQLRRADAPVLALDAHVRPREERGGEAHEGGERHQEHVERVDEELLACRASRLPFADDARGQRAGGEEGREAEHHVELGRPARAPSRRQQQRAEERNAEQERNTSAMLDTYFSSFSDSRWMQIEAVELLADLEEEHAEHQHRDQHVERDAELDDHRHAVGRAHRAEEQAVLHRQKSDHLRHGLAARDHRQECEQDDGDRDADRAARGGAGERGDRLREPEGEDHDQQAHQHRARDVEQRLGVPVHAEAPDQPMQQPGQEDTFSASVSAAERYR